MDHPKKTILCLILDFQGYERISKKRLGLQGRPRADRCKWSDMGPYTLFSAGKWGEITPISYGPLLITGDGAHLVEY